LAQAQSRLAPLVLLMHL